jgi:hypothetical protein
MGGEEALVFISISRKYTLVAQVAHHGVGLRELGRFQIDPASPKPIVFQSFDEMAADEPSGPAYKRTFCHSARFAVTVSEFRRHRKINWWLCVRSKLSYQAYSDPASRFVGGQLFALEL